MTRPASTRRRAQEFVIASAVAAAHILLAPAPAAADDWPPPSCEEADDTWTPRVGELTCVNIDSEAIGGITPVTYHVPSACAGTTCPVVYNLHGFGGSYTSQLGAPGEPSAWIHAIDQQPPADPGAVSDPWSLADPTTWVPAPPLPLIQVSIHGQTVPGGFGPKPGLESFYTDWNPRYAAGGSDQAYDTPPPRFASYLIDELLPFVDAHFPTRGDRAHRAITGTSLGGFGSFTLGLAHPDEFAVVGSVSGAHNFLFAPSPVARDAPDTSAPFLIDAGAILLPSTIGGTTLPLGPAEGFTVPFVAWGGVASDHPWYRGNMPVDLATNARAFGADGAQLTGFHAIVNDAVPRRPEDVEDGGPPEAAARIGLEAMVLAMNTDMELAWDAHGVERSYAVHPGVHSGPYWNPWLRGHLETLAAALPGAGEAATEAIPDVFDHRSIASSRTIWGWEVSVERDLMEFLDLLDVRCDGLRLRGTGIVTIDVPDRCGTGLATPDGSIADPFVVDLGAGGPITGVTGFNIGAAVETVALGAKPNVATIDAASAMPDPSPPNSTMPATGGGAAVFGVLAMLVASRCRPTATRAGPAPEQRRRPQCGS